jgi:hypothetical protein
MILLTIFALWLVAFLVCPRRDANLLYSGFHLTPDRR